MKISRRPLLVIFSLAALSLGAWHLSAEEKSAPKPAPAEARTGPKVPGAPGARLGLTDDQREKLATLREQRRDEFRAIREDANLSAEQKREKARELFKAGRTAAEAVFTPGQKERMQQVRQKERQQMRHAMRARLHHRAAGWHERQAGFGHHFDREMNRGPRHQGFAPGRGHAPGLGHGPAPGQRGRPGPMGTGPGGPGGWSRDFGHGPQGPGERAPAFGPPPGRPGDFAAIGLTDDQKAKVQALRRQQQEKMAENMKSFQEQFRAILTPEQQAKLDARGPGHGKP